MASTPQIMQDEPVATLGAALGAVSVTGIACLPLFGVPIDAAQQAALIAFASSIITLGTVYTRSKVTPVGKANGLIQEAFDSDPNIGKAPLIGKTPDL
jgi:hypothetical protein